MTARVRIAGPADEQQLFAFVWNAEEEMPVAARAEEAVGNVVKMAVHGLGVVRPPVFGIIAKSGIEAAVGLFPEAPWYSNDNVMNAFFVYVHPDHRREGHLMALRKFAETYALHSGLPLFMRVNGDDNDPKVRMMGRNARRIGSMFAVGGVA